MEFKPGDVVRLKSGGPKMTVRKKSHNQINEAEPLVTCVWFVNEEIREASFSPENLQPGEPND
jgi:uncharacterized protein YodC (DUF2158 family)